LNLSLTQTGNLLYKWTTLPQTEQSKNINIHLLGMWRPKGLKGKVHHLDPFLVPFVDDIETLFVEGKHMIIQYINTCRYSNQYPN
jgi:hypothetical protein